MKTYTTEKPCKRGHLSPRWISSGACRECVRENTRKSMRTARASDPDKFRRRERVYKRNLKLRDPEKVKSAQRAQYAKRHGVPEPTRAMPHNCECCGRHVATALMRDHDHVTGVFRGWLCKNCNVGIGNLGDSIESVRRAVAYLQRVVP